MPFQVSGIDMNSANPRTPATAVVIGKNAFLVLPVIEWSLNGLSTGKSLDKASPGTWPLGSSPPEIIARDQAEDEPGGSECSLQRTADFRFADARVVAHGDFNDSVSGQCAF